MTEETNRTERALSCPSGSAEHPHARVFGIVGGRPEAPQVAYLERPLRLSDELRARLDGVSPAEVFRVVSPCAEHGCQHFAGGRCGIASRVATLDSVERATLPACAIRATCRWFAEHGAAVCRRCPQVVTLTLASATERYRRRLPLL